MSVTVLVRGARQLLTLRGAAEPRRGAGLKELGIIRDGALLIEDGRIAEVGTSRRVESLRVARNSQEIDATGRIVMPGFVDCHAHVVGAAPPVDEGEAGFASWTPEVGRGTATALQTLRNSSATRLESRARQIVNGMARHGTTTLEAESGYGLDARGEIKVLRAHNRLNRAPLDIASTFLTPRSLPDEYAGDAAGYLAWVRGELLPAIRRRSFARYAGLRCGERVFDGEQERGYLEAARKLGFELKIHAGSSAAADAMRLAMEVGAASLDGLQEEGAADVEGLWRSSTMAVLLPGDAFQQGVRDGKGRCARARPLIEGGAALALGTNFNPGAASTYSMQAIVALACAQLGMSAEEAICGATFNAACALGLGQETGSLEAGKAADLIMLNVSDYRDLPLRFGVNLVNRTVKRGVTIYLEGSVDKGDHESS